MGADGYRSLTPEMVQTPEGLTELNRMMRELYQYVSGDGNQVKVFHGFGTPESNFAASVGSIYMRADGGANTSVYVKEAGVGSTGWVAIDKSGVFEITGGVTRMVIADELDMRSKAIQNLLNPVNDQDAATKKWAVDNLSGGGAWTLIERQVASSDSSLEFTTDIDGTYKTYVFLFEGITTGIRIRFDDDGGSGGWGALGSNTINCHTQKSMSGSTGYGTADVVVNDEYIRITGADIGGVLYMNNLHAAIGKSFYGHYTAGSSKYGGSIMAGTADTSTDTDAIEVKAEGGGTFSGTVTLYGIATS